MEENTPLLVERILNKRRLKNTTLEYLCKWVNRDYNSWVPKRSLDCSHLIKHFEDELINTYHPIKFFKSKDFRPLRIVDIIRIDEIVHFRMEFLGKDKAYVVTWEQAKMNCPDLMIQFFEKYGDINNSYLRQNNIQKNKLEHYKIDSIRNERVINGKRQLFVKWFGLPHQFNSWEDVENVNRTELIESFYKEMINNYNPILKFDNNLRPLRILRASVNSENKLCYEMEFLGTDKTEIVDAEYAKIRCIDLVLDFYEEVIFIEKVGLPASKKLFDSLKVHDTNLEIIKEVATKSNSNEEENSSDSGEDEECSESEDDNSESEADSSDTEIEIDWKSDLEFLLELQTKI